MAKPAQQIRDPEPKTRTIDSKGRVILPKEFADSLVMIEVVDEFEIRIRKVVAIPEREIWLWKNPDALKTVLAGIEQAKSGQYAEAPDIGASLSEFASDEEEET